mgnify:CR=1 FL=1
MKVTVMVSGVLAALALAAYTGGQAAGGGESLQIIGVVTEPESGRPVSGVSVYVQGTQIGTKTNAAGQYMLDAVPLGEGAVVYAQPCYRETAVRLKGSEESPLVIDVGLPFNYADSAALGCRRPR